MECPHCGKEISQTEVDKALHELERASEDLAKAMEFIEEARPDIDATFERIRQREAQLARQNVQAAMRLNAWSKN